MTLAALPTSGLPGTDGRPRFGRFKGPAGRIDWAALAPPHARSAWWRHFHHKRWQYVALSTDHLFCGVAIVDLGFPLTVRTSASTCRPATSATTRTCCGWTAG
jgi:hypothetical protein